MSRYQLYTGDVVLKGRSKVAFFPGTFDPFTLSHKEIARRIRELGYTVFLADVYKRQSWSCATQSFGPCPGSRRRAGSPLPINFPLISCIRIRSFPKRRRPMPGARMFT